jgi:4-aminobutyrate--pyruvate transaminase
MSALSNSAARDVESLLHPFTNLATFRDTGSMVISGGKGIYVFDEHGREYIEGMSGLWCTSLGFSNEELIDAATAQMRQLPYYHQFSGKSHDPGIALAEKLKDMAPVPMSKVFFTNSGSEANDSQVKFAWYFNNALGRTKKKKIISRQKAYHGVTVMAASLTGLPNLHRDFDLPIAPVLHTSCPHFWREGRDGESELEFSARLASDLEALIAREGGDTIAAFIAEPIMGAGGVIVPPKGYFEAIQPILDAHDILMIDDEVICGFGRTGNDFGARTFNMRPDSISVAKALSSAYLPIGAVMISERMYQAFLDESRKLGAFGHGYTYSGHPVSAAVALKTLEIYERERIFDHVRQVAPKFQARLKALRDHPLVGETRGVGLIGAIELVADKRAKRSFAPSVGIAPKGVIHAQREGLITRAIVETLALCPPLVITEPEIDELFDRMTRALNSLEAEAVQGKWREMI